jgi:hypothetical protein
MSEFPLPHFRKEVQNYLRSCEHLISVPAAPHNPPFTPAELQIMEYDAAEVVKMLGQVTKSPRDLHNTRSQFSYTGTPFTSPQAPNTPRHLLRSQHTSRGLR